MTDNILVKREKAFEEKFAHDEEKAFKIRARRRKFIGLWAAQQMHLNEEESLNYAIDIVKFGVGKATPDVIAEKVHQDMLDAGLDATLDEVQEKMLQCYEKAARTLEAEGEI